MEDLSGVQEESMSAPMMLATTSKYQPESGQLGRDLEGLPDSIQQPIPDFFKKLEI